MRGAWIPPSTWEAIRLPVVLAGSVLLGSYTNPVLAQAVPLALKLSRRLVEPASIGPGKALFGETFYDRIKRALKPGGFATFQTGVPFYQPDEVREALADLKRFFPQSGLYLTVVPSYIGGFMALTWAGKGARLGTPAGIKRARAAFKRAKLKTDYYNGEIHAGAFALPEWIRRLSA